MPRRYHEALGVTEGALRRYGVFNGFTDLDSQFYVDPRLLDRTRVPEFKGAGERFTKHFKNVLRLLKASKTTGDLMWAKAVKLLQFREVTHTGLGYGAAGVQGSGIGPGLAGKLAATVKALVDAGINDPSIFDLVGLFQEGYGPDRLSDTVVRLALPELLQYNERVVRRLKLPTTSIAMDGHTANLPYDQQSDRWFLLLPESILTALPIAADYSDIERLCRHNADLRDYVNDQLGDMWKDALSAMNKQDVADLLVAFPQVATDIVAAYAGAPAESYDFEKDPNCELRWHHAGRKAAGDNPLSLALPTDRPVTREDVAAVVASICASFKHLVENCGVSEVLRDDQDRARIERVSQRLFLCVADSYCRASNLDLTPEANAGSGPVDFKVSTGYEGRVLVELKRSNNPNLEHGYLKQLARYKAAEQTTEAFYVIIDYGSRDDLITRIVRKSKRDQKAGKPFSHVVRIDAQKQASASKWHG
jgi:hypothetical protein